MYGIKIGMRIQGKNECILIGHLPLLLEYSNDFVGYKILMKRKASNATPTS